MRPKLGLVLCRIPRLSLLISTQTWPIEDEDEKLDESFVDLAGIRGDMTRRNKKVRERILQWTGIHCGIGIGPTKTLAKLANFMAKTAERKPGSYLERHAQV